VHGASEGLYTSVVDGTIEQDSQSLVEGFGTGSTPAEEGKRVSVRPCRSIAQRIAGVHKTYIPAPITLNFVPGGPGDDGCCPMIEVGIGRKVNGLKILNHPGTVFFLLSQPVKV
jgi:hypothetical protein